LGLGAKEVFKKLRCREQFRLTNEARRTTSSVHGRQKKEQTSADGIPEVFTCPQFWLFDGRQLAASICCRHRCVIVKILHF